MREWKREIQQRLAGLHLAPTREAAIAEELAQYLEDYYSELLTGGASEAEAYEQTLAELSGGELLASELRREEWPADPIVFGTNRRTNMIADLWQDLRFGAQILLKQPGFTLVVVLTLALGIGANTAIFSVVNGVLLRSLPYRGPERLVALDNAYVNQMDPLSPKSAFVWRLHAQSFEQVAAYGAFDGGVNLTGVNEARRIEATEVSANFFTTLGVNPVYGRLFTEEQERAENMDVALISPSLWSQLYAGKSDAIGQRLYLNGYGFTIIGVAPADLQFPRKSDVWIPMRPGLKESVFSSPTPMRKVFARLKNGATLQQARAEMETMSKQLGLREAIAVTSLHESLVAKNRAQMLILLAAVGLVLLIACANVANLLLARGAARGKEFAVRAALGAGRRRLLRQALTEALLVAALGGLLGLLLAVCLRDLLVALSPPEIPRLDEVGLDWRVLLFNLALALLTGVLVGTLPALQASKVDLLEALKDGSQGGSDGAGWRVFNLRGGLVAGEIALALVLLAGAGLLIRSFVNVLKLDPGFDRENILTVSLTLPAAKYAGREKKGAFYQRLIERLQSIPGVVAAGATSKLPLSRTDYYSLLFEVEGREKQDAFQKRFANFLSISHDYFRAMGIPLLQGRNFTAADTDKAPLVVIINDRMARQLFPNGDALGQRIKSPLEQTAREIVGVVGSVRFKSLEEDPAKDMYLPYLQGGNPPATLVIRTVVEPLSVAGAAREAVRALDKDLPLYDIKTVEQRVSESVVQRRFLVTLISGFAALALSLAAIGIYGMVSFAVTRRTREIGVRVAFGARGSDVLRLIIWQGMRMAAAGIFTGLVAAYWLSRFIKTFLFNLAPTDPITFVGITALVAAVALLACWIPARRATKVDPLVALRCE
ncbi:MAG: ABC transporter permease [Chloracidobacterium sp.]|nr:ABC transporter permease [Chloracidobacterium sp.]